MATQYVCPMCGKDVVPKIHRTGNTSTRTKVSPLCAACEEANDKAINDTVNERLSKPTDWKDIYITLLVVLAFLVSLWLCVGLYETLGNIGELEDAKEAERQADALRTMIELYLLIVIGGGIYLREWLYPKSCTVEKNLNDGDALSQVQVGVPPADIHSDETGDEAKVAEWKQYKSKAIPILVLLTILAVVEYLIVIGDGYDNADGVFWYFPTLLSLVWLVTFIRLFWLSGRQAKIDTGSKWSYWTGILGIFLWGWGSYFVVRAFNKNGKIGSFAKTLTVVGYISILYTIFF